MFKEFCTLHKYRITYGLIGFTGFVTGLVDALVDDFTMKAFLWAFVLWLTLVVAAYKLTVMETPPRLLLQSALLVVLGTAGLLSIHHFIWLAVSVMMGAYAFIVYMAYLVYINIRSCD